MITREEAIRIAQGLIKDFKCESETMVEFCNVVIKALKQEPCEDAISRDELLKAIDTWDKFGVDDTNSLFRLDNLSLPHYVPYIHYDDVVKCIKGMPSVNPQEPRTGHWIKKTVSPYEAYRCSECNSAGCDWYKYCPSCGAKMESEE